MARKRPKRDERTLRERAACRCMQVQLRAQADANASALAALRGAP